MKKGDFLLFALIILCTAALAAGFYTRAPGKALRITLGGQPYRDIALAEAAPETFSFTSGGHHFTCEVEPGRIRVLWADCPDQVCVQSGWLDAPGQVIACVPGRVLITWPGHTASADGDVDIVLR